MTAAVAAGAALGVNTGVRAGDAAAPTIAAASLMLALPDARVRRVLGIAVLAAAMTAWGAAARDRAAAPSLTTWFDQAAGPAGRLESPVMVSGVLAADATPAGAGVALAIDVREVESAGARHGVAGRLQTHVAGDLAVARLRDWTRGRSVRAPVALRRPPMLLNFGAPSPARQLLRRPFALGGTIKSAALVEVERGALGDEAAAALRWRVRAAAARFVAPRSADAAAIVSAILIGDRAGLPDDVERRLQEAGTFHVIAISGGNVALLTALCFGTLRLVIRSPRAVALVTVAVITAFGWVVGGEASVVRAVVAAVLYLVLSVAGLRPAPVATVRVVAVLLLVADPLTAIDVGAWLSFAATLGIVTFGREWIASLGRAEEKAGKTKGLYVRVAWAAAALVAASVAAELLLLPVAAATFARVSLAGLVLNLIAIPAMALVQVAGLVVTAVATVWPGLAATAAVVASAAAAWLLDSCALVDAAPWLTWRVAPSDPFWTAGYYACLFAFMVMAGGRVRRVCLAAAAMCLAVITCAPGIEAMQPSRARVRVTLLDVGQGEAVILQTAGHRSLLIDAGGTPGPFDIGGRVVTPALWALGVRRLDWLLVSHGDRDHIGGVPAVMRDLRPQEIWEGIPVPRDLDRQNLVALAHSFGISWRTVFAGDSLESGGAIVEAMHPRPPEWERQKVRNDDSVVLRVRYGLVDFWLTGDAGGEFERTIRAEGGPRLTILKVGHHGSRTATSARLVEALRPDVAIVSAGRGNLFGHPAREVVARLEAAGASIFRTDADGAIVVETDGRTARVLTASGRSWSLTLSGVPEGERP